MSGTLSALFKRYFGHAPVSVEPLPASGSHRRYVRLSDGAVSVMGVEGTDVAENKAFLGIARHFASKGINVPKVLAVSGDGLCYIQEDLGSVSLFDAVSAGRCSGRYCAEDISLLVKAISALPKIQFEGADGLDWGLCYPTARYGRRQVLFDLNYFKYDFLKILGVRFDEEALQDDLDALCEDILSEPAEVFMYRDFSPRNVMVRGGEPWFIDFQGGRRGTIYYDVASFVWQARSAYPQQVKDALIDAYLAALRIYRQIDRQEFVHRLMPFVLLRCLQTLGAYGFRGLIEGKEHFIRSIPAAIAGIRSLLPLKYPCLSSVLSSLEDYSLSAPGAVRGSTTIEEGLRPFSHPTSFADANNLSAAAEVAHSSAVATPSSAPGAVRGSTTIEEGLRPFSHPTSFADANNLPRVAVVPEGHPAAAEGTALTVEVMSFSYRRGLPVDASGNGGGYIFDCRSIHNPGRYEQYKSLTGRDKPVIDFIESGPEMATFLQDVFELLDAHIRKYLKRGFTHLQVAFGCTGGQHRSVYAAEHTAAWILERFPEVTVELFHREQDLHRRLSDQDPLKSSQA